MSSDYSDPTNNEAILIAAQISKTVMSSALETKLGSLYINYKNNIPLCRTLEEMGNKKFPMPIQIDNTMALSVVKNIVMKKLNSMDMKFHWLRCQKNQ